MYQNLASALTFVGVKNIVDFEFCSYRSLKTSFEMQGTFRALSDADYARAVDGGLDVDRLDPQAFQRAYALGSEKGERGGLSLFDGGGGHVNSDVGYVGWQKHVDAKDAVGIHEQISKFEPKKRGVAAQTFFAEQWNQFRWTFAFEKLAIVGAPDGLCFTAQEIAKSFVYEFKSSGRIHFGYAEAVQQADIYGYLMGIPVKRVQIHDAYWSPRQYVVDGRGALSLRTRDSLDGLITTIESPVDRSNAEKVLRRFHLAYYGQSTFEKPRESKCRSCELQGTCAVRNYSHNLPSNASEREFIDFCKPRYDFWSLDVETSGEPNDPDDEFGGSQILSIALIHFDKGEIQSWFYSLVKPSRKIDWRLPSVQWASAVHQIDPKRLESAPTFRTLAATVAQRIRGKIVVGHNLSFDLRHVGKEFNRLYLEPPEPELAVCTMKLHSHLHTSFKNRLSNLVERYGPVSPSTSSKALADAALTGQALIAMSQKGYMSPHLEDLRDLVAVAKVRKPPRTRFRFNPLDGSIQTITMANKKRASW